MSWAMEEWKQGLPTKALQKIQEIETQLDKLKKERQQRQFQLESLEAALLKQKQKVENEKTETSALKREHQSLIESCDNLEKTRKKISHDLQVKESQVNYLEGQLASSKKRMDILEQENKRYNSELERSQQTATPADVQPRTPQRNLSGPMTPIKSVADSKLEELQEKYNKEMEERRRLESELKILQTKLINQTQPQSTGSFRNIARQRSSSVFPWQQSQTPSQQTPLSLETPLKKGAAMNFQWEQEETPLKHCPNSLKKTTLSTGLFNNSMDSSKQEEQLKLQNQELQTKIMDLEFRLQAQEKEMKNHTNRLHEIQFQFDKAKADLSEKERKLNKSRDDLTKMTAQCEQANTKCVMIEQKLKQVSDELSCHRQNADSTRRNVEQKLKDKERDFQQELSHQQHALQSLDQQFNQMKNKLNQEIQQAKNDYNVLQPEIDRVSAHKQKLERELDEIKQQLSSSNQMVKENQMKENDLKKKIENIQEERNCLGNQLHQNLTQIHQLEDELKKNKQELNRFRNFGEEMKYNNNIQEAEIKNLREKLDEQNKSMRINTEKLEQQISHLKMELASAFKDGKEKERISVQLNVQIGTMENEIEELQKNMQLREKAFQALKEESSSLAQWKVQNMHIVNDFQCEKEVMENKIKELQQSLEVSLNKNQQQEQNLEIYQCKSQQQSEKLKSLEDEKENLQSQTDNLKNTLDSKTAELETQKQAFEEFMKKARQEEQKYGKEVENLHVSISQLTAQIAELEKNLQEETNKVVKLEESRGMLCADYENISNLAKSKDCLIELKETEILNLKDQILKTTNNLKEQLAKVDAEKNHLMQEYEKSLLDNIEIENIKSTLESYKHDISSFKEQIASQESSLKLEKQQRSEMESKYETLLKLREELEEKNEETEKKYQNLQAEVEQKIHQLKIQHAEALQETINEKDKYIRNIAQELETNTNNLKCLQITNKELEAKLEVCLQFEKCIQEKEELISLKEKELRQLVEENEELKSSSNTVMQENVELNKINSSFADVVKRSEATLQEQTKKYEEDAVTKENAFKERKTLHEELTVKQRLLEKTVADKENAIKQLSDKINEKVIKEDGLIYQHAALEEELKHLSETCIALEENKDFLEKQLHESSQELMKKITEVEELERNHDVCSTEYNAKIVGYEEKIKTMIEEIEGLQTQLKKMAEIDNLKKELSESCARQNKIREEHNELLQEKEQMTDLIKKQAEKETMFATKLENLENNLILAQSENIKNRKLIAEKTLTSDQLKDTVITKETELQKFQAQLQLLQMDLEDKEASLESYISQLEQLQTENSNVQSKFQHCEENRTHLQKELCAVRAEIETMDLKFSESKDREELLQEQITLQNQTTEELKSEFKKQKEDLDSLEIQLAKSQNAEMQYQLKEKDIKQLQEKLFQSEIQINDLTCQNSDIESQMEARHQELKTQMQITLSNMENTLQQSEEQRTLVQKDLSKVQSELSAMHLHFIESKNREEYLMEQIALQKKTIEDLTSEIEKCKEQEALLNSMVPELQSLIATLETEKASLLSKVDFTHKIIDLGAQEYTAVKEMIVPQETGHQNIPEEKAIADNIVENEPSGEKKSLLNTIVKSDYVVEELKAELSLLQSNLIETQSALSGTKMEKETLQSQLRVLESSLDNAQIHMSAQKEHLEQLENVIQEKGDEVILLQQQLKENSTNLIVNDQTTIPVKDTHLKLRTVELEDCQVTSEQSTTLLKEQLQKQQDSVDQTWKLHQTLTATRQELESLKQQHSFEIEEWQLKLTNLTTEMENKLMAQKQQTELISAELEDARIQLQSLDLSTQSLLYASYLSEESTPRKLKRTDLKKQQRELTLTTGQLELINSLNVAPDNVQREQKASLQSGTTSKSPGYGTIRFGNSENFSKDFDDELNESNIKKECLVEQIHLANEEISVPVECQSTCEIPIGSQLQFEQESGQILHLLPDEENQKVTEVLLSEIENLRSKLDSHQNELFFKAAAYTELEKKMLLFEEEKQHLCNELKSSALENQNLSDKVKYLEEELINMISQLNVDKVKLSDVTKMLESLEVDKKDRNEQFLELENELKRTKSDKTNLEKHILEMEVDLDELQTSKQSLRKELELNQRTISVQVEKLTELEAENNGVILELSILAKTNNELEQTSKRREVKVQELEAEKIYNSNTIWGLEAEVKKLTNKLQAVAEQMKNVSKEKEDMIQEVQYLEKNSMLDMEGREELQQQLNQLKKENQSMVEQTETMQNKLNAVELEKLKLLQSLESSKLQKCEVAARLNSTEAEVAEMRPAIEKLKVRIEADQNKSRHMAENLKIGERKADSLQDRIEVLERELQTSEENMEQMILQAETAKEQVEEEKETITEKLELLTMDLNSLLSEKEALEKQLQQSQEKLERHCSNLSGKFEAAENEKLKMTEVYESSVNELQSQISHLNEKVKMSHKEVEKLRENEKNNFNQNSNLECEKIRLANQIRETDRLNVELQSANAILSKDLQVIKQQMNKHIEEKEKHQQQIADLEQLKQKDSMDLCILQIEVENLKRERENLQTAAAESQQAAQDLSAKHRVMQETKENSEKLQVSQLQASALLSQSQLEISQSEKLKLEQDVGYFQNELQITDVLKKEVDEHKQRLCCIQEEHQAVLKDLQDQHEILLESYKEKIAEMEHQVTAQDMEINNLKAAKEELNVALKDAANKVNDLTENNHKIQDGLTVANGKILKMQQEFDAEKNLISAQLEEFRNQTKNFKSQLEISQSEKLKLEQDVGYFQNELQITDVLKKEVDEHKQRLSCIQEEHQAVLKDLQDQHEILLESYKEKIAEMEHQVTAQDMEINNLKAAKEELNVALKDAANKANDLTENNRDIQDSLTIANGKILKMQQEFDAEKNLISAQSEEFKNQTESFKLQLEISRSEKYKLEQDVGYFQNELQITDVLKKEVDEHKQRLCCIQEEHQAVLKDLQDQHEVQVNSYQENLARMEQQLTAQDMEMNNLKTAKEEVDVALKDAASKAAELQKSVTKLKGDKDCAQNKLLLWMKSCKQLEHEKESLKKHIRQQEELLAKLQKSQILERPDSQIEELTAEMKELKEALEEKTKEADENMEKNWNLIKSSHKLEEENEMLNSRVVLLNNKLQQLNTRDENGIAEQVAGPRSAVHKKREKRSPAQSNSQQKHLNSPDVIRIVGLNLDAPLELAVNKIHKKCPEDHLNLTTKRVRASESKEERDELKSEVLENSAKRTRSDKELGILLRSTAQDKTSHDKTSHEPEGLPHLVKKGFADIPAVSHSPYILRRTTLLNRASSEFAVQSRISPHRQTQHKGTAQTCNKSEMTAEDSHAQQDPTESTSSSAELFWNLTSYGRATSLIFNKHSKKKKMGYVLLLGSNHKKRRCSPNAKRNLQNKINYTRNRLLGAKKMKTAKYSETMQ
ncbi:centromere protein F isoform X2 [Scyliorhinus canicula]|uniref:centromere protein F isoform X2 n=1 Tax=Scyliorhinus canicula TaxID=7830 RepID=UPI0018F6C23E|nr:centromere protein F isoform X2 [Scyliorhinus canicula]